MVVGGCRSVVGSWWGGGKVEATAPLWEHGWGESERKQGQVKAPPSTRRPRLRDHAAGDDVAGDDAANEYVDFSDQSLTDSAWCDIHIHAALMFDNFH